MENQRRHEPVPSGRPILTPMIRCKKAVDGRYILINPLKVASVEEAKGETTLWIYMEPECNHHVVGTEDGYIRALRQVLVQPTTPVVDLDPDFSYKRKPDFDPIPDEEATKV